MEHRTVRGFVLIAILTTSACAEHPTAPASPLGRQFAANASDLTPVVRATGDLSTFLPAVNVRMRTKHPGVAVREADMSFAPGGNPNRASVVIAKDHIHRERYRFVPGDARRATPGNYIRQASFALFGYADTGNGFVYAKPSIDASFASWTSLKCSSVQVVNNSYPANTFPSAILNLMGFTSDPLASDVNTIGFIPGIVFDIVLGPGSSSTVAGVTFPFVFIDDLGNPTDIDHDGNDDLAFAEIWYNGDLHWTDTGKGSNMDIETVTLHENGHAFGLGHFGKVTYNTSTGALKASPRAVMNAYILDTLREPRAADNGSFCGLWAPFHG